MLVNAPGVIVLLTATGKGKKHDKKVADEAAFTLPAGSVLYQDTGFQGFALADTTIYQPKKKAGAANSRLPKKRRTSRFPAFACGWNMPLTASNAIGLSRINYAIGKPAFATKSWKPVAVCIT